MDVIEQYNFIKLEGHRGSFYVVDEKRIDTPNGERWIYLLESEQYGDEANHPVVDAHLNVLTDDAPDGLHDLDLLDLEFPFDIREIFKEE